MRDRGLSIGSHIIQDLIGQFGRLTAQIRAVGEARGEQYQLGNSKQPHAQYHQ